MVRRLLVCLTAAGLTAGVQRRYDKLASRGDTLMVELGLTGCRSATG